MIDYISDKGQGVATKPPHLPWNNERGLDKYRFDKPIRAYSEEDVSKISHEVAEQAKRDLNKFNIAKRSAFSVVQTAAAANVTKHVGAESAVTKARKKKVDREKFKVERQKKRMDEIEKELELYEKEVNVAAELKGKAKMYRGKSAKAIAQTLLGESRRNVAEDRLKKMDFDRSKRIEFHGKRSAIDRNLADITRSVMSQAVSESRLSRAAASKLQESVTETVSRTIRATSPTTCIVRIQNIEIPPVDDSYLQKIHELKQTIRQFDELSTSLMFDTRCGVLKV